MPFDKEAQRARLAEVESQMLAKGFVKPPPAQVPVTAKPRFQTEPTAAVKQKKEPKMAVTYLVEPFTNDLGQTIQPGDPVICVKQGYNHTIKISKGTYLGLRRDSRGVRNVVVHYTELKNGYQLNGKAASYKTPGASYGKYSHTGKTSLPSKRIYPTL